MIAGRGLIVQWVGGMDWGVDWQRGGGREVARGVVHRNMAHRRG